MFESKQIRLWNIHCFTRNLLTNSDIYSFDSTRVLKQLSQNDRFMTFSSLLTSTNSNKTSINRSKLNNLLKSLNSHTFNHQIKPDRIAKTINLMTANLILARDATRMLLKANLTRKTRKKTKENITETYRTSLNVLWSRKKLYVFEKKRSKKMKMRCWKRWLRKQKISRCKKKAHSYKRDNHEKEKARESQNNQRIEKDIKIEETILSSTSKFFRFSVFDYANERICVWNREIDSSDREKRSR